MTNIKDLESYMKIALDLAKIRKGLTHPNPTVGAVIVKDGKIIGKGYHIKAGMPHAEREAIKDAKEKGYDLKGSTMFVTLEPCCHYGRTPPCTNAIIEEGISEVVIGALDQNPVVKDNTVIIRGEVKKEEEKKDENYYRRERFYGKFERVIPLPADVKIEEAKAEYQDGILKLTIPKSVQEKEVKIEIK